MSDVLVRPETAEPETEDTDPICYVCGICLVKGLYLKTVCGDDAPLDEPIIATQGIPPEACAMCVYELQHGYRCPSCGRGIGGFQ